MPRPTRILTWLMLAMLVGGHWGMLQLVGWTGMLIDYSRDATFAEAWEKTFDGEHPCAICKTVDRGISDALVDDAGRTAPGKVVKTMKLDAVVASVVVVAPLRNEALLPPTDLRQCYSGLDWEPLRRPPRHVV